MTEEKRKPKKVLKVILIIVPALLLFMACLRMRVSKPSSISVKG